MATEPSPRDTRVVLAEQSQLRAITNDVRMRMIGLLRERTWTMAALGDELALGKGSVSYHLRVLERAGVAVRLESSKVRGGTQQRWTLAGPGFELQVDGDDGASRSVLLRLLADQMALGADPRLLVSHVRLDDAGRSAAIRIIERAASEIRALRSERGVLTTVAHLAFGTGPSSAEP